MLSWVGQRVVGIMNGHSIHAGPRKGPEFLSIYLLSWMIEICIESMPISKSKSGIFRGPNNLIMNHSHG